MTPIAPLIGLLTDFFSEALDCAGALAHAQSTTRRNAEGWRVQLWHHLPGSHFQKRTLLDRESRRVCWR